MRHKIGECKAGMFVYALAFLSGVIAVQQLVNLPESSTLFLLFGFACLCFFWLVFLRKKNALIFTKQYTLICYLILMFLTGFIYSYYHAERQLSLRLDETLVGRNIVVDGFISNIPTVNGKVRRFEFVVETHQILDGEGARLATEKSSKQFPKKIRLSWYYGRTVNAGEKWQLEVRLKPPHGFMNPGGFDYEAWLFQHGIDATGYVRKSSFNKRAQETSGDINSFRQLLSEKIDALSNRLNTNGNNSFSLVKALAIGDKSSITNQQWRVLANTGTSHLMAISGLHIGLASLFVYVLVRRIVPARAMKYVPAQHIALLFGMLSALLYALIAGLSIPTQRAITMLFVLSLMLLIRRNHRPIDALGFALLSVLLIDPLAILSAGFWFSFSAVAVIFIGVSNAKKQFGVNVSLWQKIFAVLKQWIRLQLLISLFLLPLSLFMFQQVSLVSPLVNLLLIPYVSFLVVPLVLLAIICFFIMPFFSDMLFTAAKMFLDFVWPLLSFVSAQPYALWIKGDVSIVELLMAAITMLLIFYARRITCHIFDCKKTKMCNRVSWLFRLCACLLFTPLLITNKKNLNNGEYQLTVLDVGQGSAAVIQTQNHVLVFDAGAKFSDRLNAGSGVVMPYLRSQGIKNLDTLIISHGDADHIGGAQAILNEYPDVVLIGQNIENLQPKNVQVGSKQLCVADMKWQWDGVDFAFLSPKKVFSSLRQGKKRNNVSCVLQISSKAGKTLFTGDIEKAAEKQLLQQYGKQLASDVLIVPHHGSKTSSSLAFVQTVNPKIALISVGYKNRYRLPSNKIVARYQLLNRDVLQTDSSGAITIQLTKDAGISIERHREMARAFWHY
ncbi:DNA internalization-related competence protein ComEC/Rec2 [hydrothermal vent metagenome]|uniref:DNA internalization-related competence protein ComEC/Rec2 n=1 Tax=hydrothermal vent metagenome TaxID=652676 RepID=A0A3B0X880_9ZZZZ